MAQVLKAGSIKVDINADAANFIKGFKSAVSALREFGDEEQKVDSKTKRVKDTLENLERQKKTLTKQLELAKNKFGENSIAVDKLGDRLAYLNDRINTNVIRLGEVSNDANRMASSMENAGNRMGFVAHTISTAVGNVIADAFSNASQRVYDFTTSVFDSAMQTEKQGIAFRVLTGSLGNAQSLMQEINDMAVKTPFNIAEIRELTKQMLSFRFSQKEVIPTMKMLGDITAGTGGDLTLLSRAFGQVKTKGKLYAQELNQLGEQGVAVRETIADLRNISVAELTEGMQTGEITVDFKEFSDVIEKIHKEKFFNLMGEQADAASGRMQNLGETLNLIGQEILGIDTTTGQVQAGGLFDTFSQKIGNLLNFLRDNKDIIITFFSEFTDKLSELIKATGEMTFEAFDKFQDFSAWIKDNYIAVVLGLSAIAGAYIGSLIPALLASIPVMISWAVTMFTVTIPAIISAMIALAPFILIGALIAVLIAGIVLAVMNWGTITEWFTQKWNEFTSWFTNLEWVKKTVKFFEDAWTGTASFFTNLWTGIVTFFTNLWNGIITYFTNLWNIVTGIVNTVMAEIQRVLSNGFAYTVGYLLGLGVKLFLGFIAILSQIGVFIGNVFVNAILSIGNLFQWMFKTGTAMTVMMLMSIKQFFIDVWNGFLQLILDIGNFFDWLLKTAVSVFWNTIRLIQEQWNNLLQFIANLPNKFREYFTWITGEAQKMQDQFNKELQKIVEWFQNTNWKQLMVDAINGLLKGLSDNMNRLVNEGKNMANNFSKGFKDAMGIQSPSKVMIEAGVDIVDGLDEGIDSKTMDLERRVSVMGDIVTDFDDDKPKKPRPVRGGLTINQYGASISTSWIPSYAR